MREVSKGKLNPCRMHQEPADKAEQSLGLTPPSSSFPGRSQPKEQPCSPRGHQMPSPTPMPPPAPRSPAQLPAAMAKVPAISRIGELEQDLLGNNDVPNFGSAYTVAKVGLP